MFSSNHCYYYSRNYHPTLISYLSVVWIPPASVYNLYHHTLNMVVLCSEYQVHIEFEYIYYLPENGDWHQPCTYKLYIPFVELEPY